MALQQAGLEWVHKNLGPFLSNLNKSNAEIAKTGAATEGTSSKFNLLGSVVTGVSTAVAGAVIDMGKKVAGTLVALGKDSLNMAAEFQSMESRLAIAAGDAAAAADQFGGLGEVALAVGGDTRLLGVSATGAAEAMTGLLKAGIPLEDVMGDLNAYMDEGAQLGGILRASIDLAAATELDMVEASDMASVAMATFGLTAEETNEAMDYMVRAADASVAEVSGLRDSMVNVGASAAAMGFSFEEVNTALAVLSTRGIQGAEAGTALKSMMTNLMRTTPAVTSALEENGITLFDNAGNMRSMVDIIAQFQIATESMTEAQRNQFVQTVAGTYGMKTLNTLMAEGVEGWMSMESAIGSATGIQVQAEKASQTYAGQLEALEGNIETLKIRIGTAFLPIANRMLGVFSTLIDKIGPPVVEIVQKIGAAIDAIFGALTTGDTSALMETFHLDPSWADTFRAIGDAVERIIGIFTGGPDVNFDAKFGISQDSSSILSRIADAAQRILDTIFGTKASMDDKFMLDPRTADTTVSVIDRVIAVIEKIPETIERVKASFEKIKQWLANLWGGDGETESMDARFQISPEAESNISSISELIEKLIATFVKIKDWVVENWPTIQGVIQTAAKIIGDVFSSLGEVLKSTGPDFKKLFDRLREFDWETVGKAAAAFGVILGAVFTTAVAVVSGAVKGVMGIIDGLMDFFEGWADAVRDIFEGWAEKDMGKILKGFGKLFVNNITAPFKIVTKAVKGFVKGFINFFKSLSKKLIGKSIIPDMMKAIVKVIEKGFEDVIKFVKDAFKKIVNAVEDGMEKAKQIIGDIIDKIKDAWKRGWSAVQDALEKAWGKIKEIVSKGLDALLSLIENALSDFKKKGKEIAHNIAEGIKTTWSKVTSAISDGIDKLVSTIRDKLNDFKKKGSEIANKIKDGITSAWSSVTSAISSGISNLVSAISNKLGEFIQKGRDIASRIADGIKAAWGNVKNAISSGISGLVSAVTSLASTIRGFGSKIVDYIKSGIMTFWGNIKDALSSLVSGLTSSVSWSNIASAGSRIVNALIDGIKSNWHRFVNWLKEAIKGIWGGSEPTDPTSPFTTPRLASRGRQIGQTMMAGIQEGITEALAGYQAMLSMALPTALTGPAMAVAAPAGGTTTTTTIAPNVTIGPITITDEMDMAVFEARVRQAVADAI
jgi:TP901 family phage tail tape measure protein